MNGDIIEDVKFKTYGCGSAIASSTMFVEMLKGKTIEQAKQIKDKDIADALELPAIKLHCSVLAEEGIHRAIENWEEKLPIGDIIMQTVTKDFPNGEVVEFNENFIMHARGFFDDAACDDMIDYFHTAKKHGQTQIREEYDTSNTLEKSDDATVNFPSYHPQSKSDLTVSTVIL